MTRVLIVEDEAPIRDGLAALMDTQGIAALAVSDGARALAVLGAERFDLVVLDLMIPEVPGLDVLRAMRARGDETPVLVLTALGAEDDVVAGLEAGADDYVTKPFGVRELVARARGLLRRPRAETARTVRLDAATLDLETCVIAHAGGELRVSARESLLLAHLATRAPRTISREELLVEVWGYRDGSIRTRTIDVHVQQLRAKLRPIGGESWVTTVRGVGYRYEPAE